MLVEGQAHGKGVCATGAGSCETGLHPDTSDLQRFLQPEDARLSSSRVKGSRLVLKDLCLN